MQPASLSTFAVMNPGPTTAKNSRIRVFQRLRNLMGAVQKHGSSTTRQNKCREEFWIGEIWISRHFKDREVAGLFQLNDSSVLECGQFDKRKKRQSFSRSRLMTSSEVMPQVRRFFSSTTGRVSRLYLSNCSATSFSEASALQEIRGSWVSASKGGVGEDKTSLDGGTVPARV